MNTPTKGRRSMKRIVSVANVYNRKRDLTFTIRGDARFAGQVFVQAPPVSSLSEEEVINLCDALTDMLEELQQAN